MIKPGEKGAARFVGEFSTFDAAEAACGPGDVALLLQGDVEPNIVVRCAICGNFNHLPQRGPTKWALTSREPVTIVPSIRTRHDHRGDHTSDRVCHYSIVDGAFIAHADSTPR